jgi:hypothetical protein
MISVSGVSVVYSGSAVVPVVTTTPSGLLYNISYGGNHTDYGNSSYNVRINDANYSGEVDGTISISKYPATVNVSNLSGIYNGLERAPTVTTVPAGLEYSIVYTGDNTNVGSACTFVVSLTNIDYSGEARGTLIINKAPLTIAAKNQSRAYYSPASISSTEFSYTNAALGGDPHVSSTFDVVGLVGSDSVSDVTVSLDSSYNSVSTSVTTQNANLAGDRPYVGVLIPSAATGSGLSNYTISYVAGNLSVYPTLPEPVTECIATHGPGLLVFSWTPPDNDGGIPITAYRLYYGQGGSGIDTDNYRTLTPHVDFQASDLNTGSISAGINDSPYIFLIEAINGVGQGRNPSRYTETIIQNTQNAAEQLNRISEATDGELDVTSAALIETIVEASGADTYAELEALRAGADTVSDTVYAYMEAAAIVQIGGDSLGIPQDITGDDALAIYEHMLQASIDYPGSVQDSLLEDLLHDICNNVAIHTTYVKFEIGLDGIQVEPYPIIPAGVSPVPHGIEIKFYIRATSIADPTQSGLVLVTRNANNYITSVEPSTGSLAVDGFEIPPGGAGAGLSLYVTLTSGLGAGAVIPALADIFVAKLPDRPTDVRIYWKEKYSNDIRIYWKNVNDSSIISYTITPEIGAPITIAAADVTSNSISLSTVLIAPLSSSFTVTATNSYGDSDASAVAAMPCFPAGTRILTPAGYRAVETLKQGDIVTTAAGLTVPVIVYSRCIKMATKATAPYIIPAHSFGRNAPRAELRLSPLHAFQTAKGVWQIPRFAAETNKKVQQYGLGESVTYYHLECPNFFRDNLVVDGCVVESFAGKQVPVGLTVYTPSRRLGGYTRVSEPSTSKISHC